MSRLRNLLVDSRTLSFIGIVALAAFFFLGADTLELALYWAALASGAILLAWFCVWLWRRRQARRAADRLDSVLDAQAATIQARSASASQPEIAALRERLNAAIKTIRRSRLGQQSGRAALYELPWYMLIGNPAAGKSSAVLSSGLTFPFADQEGSVIQGVGGTRNCDWFFTTEGILLDTAGRYAIHEEDRSEWLGFLDLLRRYRPRAPINGIVVAASIAELAGSPPEFAITLAKKLRQRVQELTERLEVHAPVYLMFTKADLITGFNEFFQDADSSERNRVWGASLPFEPDRGNDAIARFDTHFDVLYQGLREMSVAQMSLARGGTMPPGLLAFPLEFAALKPALRAFVATLFEDNPFQFKPVFRGFYFTSALQEGETRSNAEARIEQRFELTSDALQTTRIASRNGFFLKDLFGRVIFADRRLVRRQTSRTRQRLRLGAFALSMALLGGALAGWTWSYMGNRQLLSNVEADLDKAVSLQAGRSDLQSRLEALEILQDRLDQLQRFREARPLSISLGLYQGDRIEARLRREYYAGIGIVLLKPVSQNLEAFLDEVNRNADALEAAPETTAVASPMLAGAPYREASPRKVEDAYNALKTYLMLAAPEHVEVGHLSDQLTRFWRGWLDNNRGNMPREQMIRLAERILSFHLAHAADPDWPRIRPNLALVDQARQNLRRVVRGMPARDRVYAEIKARASTRFAPLTVASIVGKDNARLVAGSSVVSGAFTVEAWREHVEPEIRRAANESLQSADWVLNISTRDDLTLEGSPEQIRKQLVATYKAEYASAWKAFVQGIAVNRFDDFGDALDRVNTLGDPQRSPIGTLLRAIDAQTSWDNPGQLNVGLERAQKGFVEWFKRSILRMAPSRVAVDVNVAAPSAGVQMGPIGEAFSGISRLTAARESSPSLLDTYLKQLSAVRGRLNQLRNQGDPGPGARKLMQETIEGGGSELAETLRFVDEQMLAGMNDAQRVVIRPLLVRPLLQTFNALVEPTETELNKIWQAQVLDPFNNGLATKYPFSAAARIEATPAEIGKIFGPEGAITRYLDTAVGPLVVRRGDLVTPRTWGDLGVRLNPAFVTGVGPWVAPLAGAADAGTAGTPGAASGRTVFQLQPRPVPGTAEYTVEIDGQKLRYRNTPPQWANFVWPNEGGTPGARITATTFDGKTIEIVNHPGRFGLERLISSAQRKRLADGSFEMSWTADALTVSLALRIISSPETRASDASAPTRPGLAGTHLPERIAGPPPESAELARNEGVR